MGVHFKVNVCILTDSLGEWWEDLCKDGSTQRFIRGSAQYNPPKEYKTQQSAMRSVAKNVYKRYRILKMTPPVPPSRTWGQETVYEHRSDK